MEAVEEMEIILKHYRNVIINVGHKEMGKAEKNEHDVYIFLQVRILNETVTICFYFFFYFKQGMNNPNIFSD